MNTAKYVDEQIKVLKNSGIPLSDAAWEAALLCEGWPYIFGDRGEYCTPEKRKAVYNKHGGETLITKCQVLNGKKTDCGGCKWYPNGCRVRSFDCRGFTYWILLQIYGWKLMGAGATSQWNDENNWKAKGTIDTIPEDKLVCLFYPDKNDPRKMAHTGFGYKGQTLECSNGVQHFTTRNKKWTHWGLPACVEGDAPEPTPKPDPEPGDDRPTLRKGDKGEYVTLLQTMLINKGYSCGAKGADGIFGNDTLKSVKEFQSDAGLTADGIVGKKTWFALDSAQPVHSLYTVHIPGMSLEQAEGIIAQYQGAWMTREG